MYTTILKNLGHWAVKALLLLGSLLFAWSIVGVFLLGQQSQIPPDVLMVNDLNCVIRQHQKTWQTTCTATYLNHENSHHDPWIVQFPQRKSEPAANKDADQWMKQVRKIQATTRPVDVKELKKEKR